MECKIVVFGANGVGKSAITVRLLTQKERRSTGSTRAKLEMMILSLEKFIGEYGHKTTESFTKSIDHGGKKIKLIIKVNFFNFYLKFNNVLK